MKEERSQKIDLIILKDVANGVGRTETAQKIGKTIRTVERRLELMRAKNDAKSLPNLIAISFRKKLID